MQVIASCLESGAALDTDFTVVNGAGEFPEPAVLRQRLAALCTWALCTWRCERGALNMAVNESRIMRPVNMAR